jgi:hypothetical protein
LRIDRAAETPAAVPTAVSPAAPASHRALDFRLRGCLIS